MVIIYKGNKIDVVDWVGGGLTFSYGQCLYCFIGLVQIKTSVLRREMETTGPEWKKLKTYKHLDIPAAQT